MGRGLLLGPGVGLERGVARSVLRCALAARSASSALCRRRSSAATAVCAYRSSRSLLAFSCRSFRRSSAHTWRCPLESMPDFGYSTLQCAQVRQPGCNSSAAGCATLIKAPKLLYMAAEYNGIQAAQPCPLLVMHRAQISRGPTF